MKARSPKTGSARLWSMGLTLACGGAALLPACGGRAPQSSPTDEPPDGLDWSSGTPSFLADRTEAARYTGSDETVLEAQDHFPTGSELHSKVVLRSCGPLNGVCHNQKEYPDMRTPYNFLSVIDAPCNVQPGTLESVFDRCERVGDRFALDDGAELEIGWIEVIADESDGEEEIEVGPGMPGLHIHLADPVGEIDGDQWLTGRFVRTFIREGSVENLSYSRITTRWHVFDDGRHVVGETDDGERADAASELLVVGVEQGDLNRNGTFGARPDENGVTRGPVSLITRGDPETSYLVARMRGHMEEIPIPGSRMPLANPPFSVAEMLAFFCFIEGLPAEGEVNLASPIDYANCSYVDPATHPALSVEGVGTGWLDRVKPLLESNCGGCHSKERAEADLVLVGDDVYDNLVSKPAAGDPLGRNYIEPSDPSASYLFLKLTADDSIDGKAMPLDPLDGVRTLSNSELGAIETWITEGASP